MPLKIIRRSDTGALTISGTVKLPDGSKLRIRARAQSDRLDLAREEAAAIEAQILRDNWHGERSGSRSFAEAVESYLLSAPRSAGDKARLKRIMVALGDVPLAAVKQPAINRLRGRILSADASPSTVNRGIITPIRAVMRHAHKLGWCEPPLFEIPKRQPGRTNYLLPAEAERLIAAAAPHLKRCLFFFSGPAHA